MRERTARPVDTYSAPDQTSLLNTGLRNKQMHKALNQWGVNVKAKAERDHREEVEEYEHRTRLAANGSAALGRTAIAVAGQDRYRDASEEDIQSLPEVQAAFDSISSIADPKQRQLSQQQLSQALQSQLEQHARTREHAQYVNHFTNAVGGVMDTDLDGLGGFIKENIPLIGAENAYSAAGEMAVKTGNIKAVERLLSDDDLPSDVRIQLEGALASAKKSAGSKKSALYGFHKRLINLTSLADAPRAMQSLSFLLSGGAGELTEKERGGLLADKMLLQDKLEQFSAVQDLYSGGISRQQLYGNFPRLSNKDINDVGNGMYLQAKAQGLEAEIQFLSMNPHSLPPSYTSEYRSFIGSLQVLDRNDHDGVATAEAQWKRHAQIMEAVGPHAIDQIMQRDAQRVFVFNTKVRNSSFRDALTLTQRWDENRAMNGGLGLRVPKKIAEQVRESIYSDLDVPTGLSLEVDAQINSFLNEARQQGVTDEDSLVEFVTKGITPLLVDGIPNARPLQDFLNREYSEHEFQIPEAIEAVRRQVGLGGLEVPKDAGVYFQQTGAGQFMFFTDPDTGVPYHPEPLDAHKVFHEYMESNPQIKTRKERNLSVSRTRKHEGAAARERIINRSASGTGIF